MSNDLRFVLQIELSDEAMKDIEDIPDALHKVADRIALGSTNGTIRDVNGNTVGGYRLWEQEDA